MIRRNKYNNKKVVIDGIKFDSKREGEYYEHLKCLKQAGKSQILNCNQSLYYRRVSKNTVESFLPINYVADFRVWLPDGTDYVIDIKGHETPDFKIKRKLFDKRYEDLHLKLITYSKIDGGWITLEDLKEACKKRKKAKEEGKTK